MRLVKISQKSLNGYDYGRLRRDILDRFYINLANIIWLVYLNGDFILNFDWNCNFN